MPRTGRDSRSTEPETSRASGSTARHRSMTLVTWRLLRRTHERSRGKIELWAGNYEGTWRESLGYVIWPALKRAFTNRRTVPEQIERLYAAMRRVLAEAAQGLGLKDAAATYYKRALEAGARYGCGTEGGFDCEGFDVQKRAQAALKL